jgi:hypothetical protein
MKAYSKLVMEIVRGDKKEKEVIPVQIYPGENLAVVNTIFNTKSKFYLVKDTGVF